MLEQLEQEVRAELALEAENRLKVKLDAAIELSAAMVTEVQRSHQELLDARASLTPTVEEVKEESTPEEPAQG